MLWIACTEGEDKGLALQLGDQPVLLGRQIDCDMQLKDSRASRHHCRLTLDDRRLTVEDLGSSNGVKFNGKRYRRDSFKLWPGQGFRIGGDEFAFTDELKDDKPDVIDLTDVATKKTVVSIQDDFGDSSTLLSDAEREELSRAAEEKKKRQMREVATKTVWERITGFIRRDD